MKLAKLILPLITVATLFGCDVIKTPDQEEIQKKRETYQTELNKELNTYITGVVISESYAQEIVKNPEHNGLLVHSNPTMTLGEDFYSIKIKDSRNQTYSINILDGLNGATKKSLNLLVDEGDTITFKSSNKDLPEWENSIWNPCRELETNFYPNPEQQTGSKYASRIQVIPKK